MNSQLSNHWLTTRRHFLGGAGLGIGAVALAGLLDERRAAAAGVSGALADLPHFPSKAKRVIYLFQSGGPSQIDLFDYKPRLREWQASELPDSVRRGQRLTGMTSRQLSFPIAASKYKFAKHGQSGAWVSELMPHTARVVDRLCFVKSMFTEAINHDPAITFFQTGAKSPEGLASDPGCRMVSARRIKICLRLSRWCRKGAAIPMISRSTID